MCVICPSFLLCHFSLSNFLFFSGFIFFFQLLGFSLSSAWSKSLESCIMHNYLDFPKYFFGLYSETT